MSAEQCRRADHMESNTPGGVVDRGGERVPGAGRQHSERHADRRAPVGSQHEPVHDLREQ